MDDGRELPLFKLETTSEIAPVLHRHAEERRQPGRPRREVPQQVRPRRRQEVSVRACSAQHKAASAAFFVAGAAPCCRSGMIARLNTPNPALVTQRAAQRLPRVALLLFCAAYVLPGLFGRDPWSNADVTAFGYMAEHRRGPHGLAGARRSAACRPTPRCCRYWLGAAASSRCSAPWLDPALAARLPFALLLALVLVLTWYTTYHLARTDAAQPLPFAFGGEANPVDYARAIADGARAGADRHAGPAAARPRDDARAGAAGRVRAVPVRAGGSAVSRPARRALAVLAALPALAASGAPASALALGAGRHARLRALELPAGARASRPGWPPPACSPRRWPRRCGAWAWRVGRLRLAGAAARHRLRLLAVVHLAGLAAGAVDAVALAPPPAAPAHLRCRWAAPLVGRGWPASRWAARTAR